MLPTECAPPLRQSPRSRGLYLEVEDGLHDETTENEWADFFQNCLCLLSPWTAVAAAFDQRKQRGPQRPLNSPHDGAEESLLSQVSKRRRFCQVKPMVRKKKLTYNMSIQPIEYEPPFHVSLTPRYYGMCPLGHQEIVYFK